VHLLAVSWDIDEEYWAINLFPPLMVVELANTDTPTLHAFYMNRSDSKSFSTDVGFIADIADGLSALHMCGIIHGDLKPENILLFKDSETTGGLIAKLADFGFANVEFLKESIRGGSEEWAAPECIRGCPEEIMTAMQELDIAEFACDVYSFGLVAMFVALDGVQSLATQEFGPHDTTTVDCEKAMRELKFTDQAKTKVEQQVCAFYQELDGQESESAKGLCECYVSLIHDTLQSIPTKRVISLSGMRLRLTGR
jgi:serine/threonine protein kinase